MKVIACLFLGAISSLSSYGKGNPLKLIYTEPATKVYSAIPLGNGRLGALVYGGVNEETISLNDDTFWSGEPKDWNNPNAPSIIPQVHEALLKGDHELADKLAMKMQGPYNQSYQPLGAVKIAFNHKGDISGYTRSLDLETALSKVSYTADGVKYTRTAFASNPNQVIAILLESDKPNKISFKVTLEGKHQQEVKAIGSNLLESKGKAPAQVDPSYLDTKNPVIYEKDGKGMRYTTLLKAEAKGGIVTAKGNTLEVKNATRVVLYIAARTSYNGYDKSPSAQGLDSDKLAKSDLQRLGKRTFQQLLQAHVQDYQKLFKRVDLVLGADEQTALPFKEYVDGYKKSGNPKLAQLVFQMGRYLTISGSRIGTQPLNLQGIWNEWVRPPWSSNYTLNINTQMNYWPVLTTNLAECHQPLLKFVEELAKNGEKTAKVNYGCRGWVAHHNADLWRQSSPVGDGSGEPSWANFTGGGIWLTFDFWEHYQYTQDLTFLRKEAYPLMKGAVEFSADWLKKNSKGYYEPPFTVSSEATYITPTGYKGYCVLNSGQDIALYGELMTNFIKTCDILNIKDDIYNKAKDILAHLEPYQIDPEGKIKEWLEEGIDRPKGGNKNHVSHLIGFFPGRHLILQNDPLLVNAVKRTLELFGPGNSTWMYAWEISLWARLKDGEKSYDMVKRLLDRYSSNVFNPEGAYQLDWQFGYTGGIAEMLMQSHLTDKEGNPVIELLPALPKEWSTGHVSGLRARGGYLVSIAWKNGKVTKATVKNISNMSSRSPKVTFVANGISVMKQIPLEREVIVL